MHVLITGGAGFIGSHLAEALLARGDHVTIIDNLTTGRRENVPEGANFEQQDIANPEIDAFEGLDEPDAIIHAAATYANPQAWERDAIVNGAGSALVARFAAECGAPLIYFQTSLCYGPPKGPKPFRVGDPLDPRGSYAASKTAGEHYVRMHGKSWSFRLANICGPRNLSGPIPAFYRRLKAGQPCTVVDTRRDFVHVRDIVDPVLRAVDQLYPPGIYHLASGADVPISSIFTCVRDALQLDVRAEHLPRDPDDVATILLSMQDAPPGWAPTRTISEAIADAVAWYEAHGVDRTFTHLESARLR